MDDKKNIRYFIATLVFFVFSVMIMGPLSIYLPNSEELSFGLKDVLLNITVVSVLTIIALAVLFLITPSKYKILFIVVLFSASLILYIQGNFIPNSFGTGVLDGTAVDWEAQRTPAMLNLIFCLAVFLVVLLFYDNNKKAILYISIASLFLTAIQIPALVVQLLNYSPKSESTLIIDKGNEFIFSDDENIVFIILDTIDEEYFNTYEKNHPEFAENMIGFVHYDNAFTAGARTLIALPIYYTGEPFIKDQTYSQYLEKAYSNSGLLDKISNNGFDVRIYSEKLYFPNQLSKTVSNFSLSNQSVGVNRILIKKLYKVTLYKYLPTVLKPFFFFDTSEFQEVNNIGITQKYTCDDIQFFKDLQSTADFESSTDKKTFVTYHLNGVHSPYKIGTDGTKDSNATLETQTEGVFYMTLELLNRLKEHGFYDNSTIIITSDHGDLDYAQHPILFIKEKNCNEDYKTSHKAISAFDIPVLFAKTAGVTFDENIYGMDIDELEESENRTRHLFYNSTGSSQVNIIEYVSDSEANDVDAVVKVNTYVDVIDSNTPYVLGTELSFEADATGNVYGVEGMSTNTGFRTMLRGPISSLDIPFSGLRANKDVRAHIKLHSKSTKGLQLIIYANEKEVYSNTVDKDVVSEGIEFTIPIDYFENNRLKLDFVFPDIDEKEMDLSSGKRTETISLVSITFE